MFLISLLFWQSLPDSVCARTVSQESKDSESNRDAKFESLLSESSCQIQKHHFKEALRLLDEAIKSRPRSARALSLKARALRYLNRKEEALALIKQAKEAEPKSIQPYITMASFCLKDKNVGKAREYLAQAEKIEPQSYEIEGLKGTCLILEKNPKAAFVYVDRALSKHPDAPRYAQRAAIYRVLGDRKNELKDYEKAISLDSKNPVYATERATTLFYLHDLQRALTEVNRAIALDDKYAQAYFIRANINWLLKQAPLVLSDMDKALSLEENASYFYFRSTVFEVRRELSRALSDLLKADKLAPDEAYIKFAIGRVYHGLLEPKLALKYTTRAIELDPNNSEYYDQRSQIYRTMMEYELAVLDDTRSIEHAKQPPINALINRVRYYRFNKKYDLALKDQNRIISYYPKRAGLKEARALIYLERAEHTKNKSDYIRAKEDFDLVITTHPNDCNYSLRAKANLKLGNLKEALADINQAIVKQPGMSSYYQMRAEIHKVMGKPDEARKDLAAAKSADEAALPPH